MPQPQFTYWSMTLNNPTESEMVLIRNPNEKYIRQFVWTPEEGQETGTPHIQGWLRLQRNQSLSFLKKLYPRASFKGIEKDEYNENTHNYAQKNDGTERGAHNITLNDPLPSPERLVEEVLFATADRLIEEGRFETVGQVVSYRPYELFREYRARIESDLVRKKGAYYAKVFLSPIYKKLWLEYGKEIFYFWLDKQNADLSESENGSEDASDSQEGSTQGEETASTDEGGSSSSGSEDDCSEYGE